MNLEIITEMKEKIAESDLVLVGIGEQLAFPTRKMEDESKYSEFLKKYGEDEIYPYLQQAYIEENSQAYIEFYNRLYDLIKDKNYYIITTNVDDIIYASKLDANRVVSPCGSIHQFVCEACKDNIETFEEEKIIDNLKIICKDKNGEIETLKCSNCGKTLVPNIVVYDHYNENGYLEKWNRYTRWLQGTVNKNLCILELGVGLSYPTVIRWPNERIVTYNNKAFMFRIHEKLYQLSEGIGERAKSVPENPINLI